MKTTGVFRNVIRKISITINKDATMQRCFFFFFFFFFVFFSEGGISNLFPVHSVFRNAIYFRHWKQARVVF